MSHPYDDPICSPKYERRLNKEFQKKRMRGACVYCGSPHAITKDHIHPKSRGGKGSFENLQPLCAYCNGQKGNKTELEIKIIFSYIKTNGIMYEWERPYSRWLGWLEIVCVERKHRCPLFHRSGVRTMRTTDIL